MIKFHGKWSSAGNRYTEVDVKLLKSEKGQNRLCDHLSKSEHVFDMHFYKGPKSSWETSLVGNQRPEWVAQKYGIDIQPSDDKISVLVTSNIGSPKYPLTPWIIAHRMSHSLWGDYGYNLYIPISRRLGELVHGDNYMFFGGSKWFGCAIGTTRSCRNRTLARNGELFHELFAQVLITGRVRLKRIENRVLVRHRGRNAEYAYFSDEKVAAINRNIDALENAVYTVYSHLHSMYGSVIVV